ncbi:hypothetical protein H072_528 [Dactylellina haptotyla CBS 200.50]|uniref:Uncharacterized protein n=1 Tax=Dactylellina haptotyla (strain CBS 200.50) TaxID=1284197 RepID=S8C185_DACHA|nr:hypothetical protein H072_528 [Dactylellina haptotyla CBS 200.50]
MADPLSLIATIGSLVGVSLKIASEVNSICESYSSASGTLSSLSVECSVTTAVLQRLENLLRSRPELLSASSSSFQNNIRPGASLSIDLQQSFEVAAKGISKSLTKLGTDIQSITRNSGGNTGGRLSFLGKAKFVWNEDDLKLSLTNLQNQRSSLQFLIECIQTETLSNIQTHLQNGIPQPVPTKNPPPVSHPPIQQNASVTPAISYVAASPKINQQARLKALQLRQKLSRLSDDPAQQLIKSKLALKPGKIYKSTPQLAMKLHRAIDEGNDRVAKYLREDRVNPNILLGDSPLSPLHRAIEVWDGNSEVRCCILNLFIVGSGDLNAPDPGGLRPLSKLLQSPINNSTGYLVQLLCENGARPELPDRTPEAKTPLHWLVDRCKPPTAIHYSILHVLVAFGANIDGLDTAGESVLLRAIKENQVDLVRDLVEECGADTEAGVSAKPDSPSCYLPSGHSPLSAATFFKSLPILQTLISGGANVNRVINGVRTAVQVAVVVQAIDELKFLISKGASLRIATGDDKWIPIHWAANGRFEATKVLVESGSPLETEDKEGETPLLAAVRGKYVDIVKYLISKHANLEHANNKGFRTLHVAASLGHLETVQFLVEAGAIINSPGGKLGWTALHLAAEMGFSNIVEYLVTHGANLEAELYPPLNLTPIFLATSTSKVESTQLLIKLGANVWKKAGPGYDSTVLHVACDPVEDNLAVVPFLLEYGFDVNTQAKNGATGLHIAALKGHTSIVKFLLQNGARTDIHAIDIFETLEDIEAKTNGTSGTPAQVARLKGFKDLATVIENWPAR